MKVYTFKVEYGFYLWPTIHIVFVRRLGLHEIYIYCWKWTIDIAI